MIKLPIKPLTPPIRVTKPSGQQAAATQSQPTSGATSGGASGGSSGGNQSRIPSFESLFQEMLAHYMPETVAFTPLSEEVLSETIRNWLRPAYEQAIQNRREQTERINAELDADAWSRGMGQSTYLSDVKERQLEHESRDVDTLESNYASALAQQLYDAMKAQQSEQLEVDRFNAEQINRAREKAAAAAQSLYQAYLSGASHGSGSASAQAQGQGASGTSFAQAVMNGKPEQSNSAPNATEDSNERENQNFAEKRGVPFSGSDP